MPNILIHPNSGIIEFSTGIAGEGTFNTNFTGGASVVRLSYNNAGGLSLTNYSTGVVSGLDRFSVDGINGRLFSVTDNLSGSLFSVNDIAGLPIIEAFDDNTVIMGAFNRNDFVLTGNSLGLGGLPNTGDTKLYVSGNIRVSGNIFVSGNPVLTGIDLSSYATNTNLASTGSTLQTNINNLSGYINSTGSNIVFTTGNQTISGNKTFTNNLIYSVSPRESGTNFTPNADLYTFFDFVLTGNSTLNEPTNMVNGESITIFLNQDSSGSRNITFNSAYLFSNGITPTLNFVPSGVDIMQVIRVNNRYFSTFASNY